MYKINSRICRVLVFWISKLCTTMELQQKPTETDVSILKKNSEKARSLLSKSNKATHFSPIFNSCSKPNLAFWTFSELQLHPLQFQHYQAKPNNYKEGISNLRKSTVHAKDFIIHSTTFQIIILLDSRLQMCFCERIGIRLSSVL